MGGPFDPPGRSRVKDGSHFATFPLAKLCGTVTHNS